jgi:hypothetical protein
MRRQIEQAFETRMGGAPMVPWMFQQHNGGASLREIARRLSELTLLSVSHESVRTWMRDG